MKSAAQILVAALVGHGAERIFCVPGESYLAVLDALYDAPIDIVTCRQEGGAAMMAEAAGKFTGQPGLCFVTRGPGATNAASGVHVAAQDSTPMILFIGQVATHNRDREAFQEIDYSRFFASMSKWVGVIDDARRIPEMIARAWSIALAGRPGPVIIVLPENMLRERIDEPQAVVAPRPPLATAPGDDAMADFMRLLSAAQRPIAILGGSRWSAAAVADFTNFAERFALPVCCSFRRQMLFNHTHPHYAGEVGVGMNPLLGARIAEADLVLILGARFSEMASQNYRLLDIPTPQQTLIHVYPGAEELGRVYQPDLAIHADPISFVGALKRLQPAGDPVWREQIASAHRDYQSWSDCALTVPGPLQPAQLIAQLASMVPEDSVIVNGAGNYTVWVSRFWQFRGYQTQLAPISGSMGYSLPAAIAAKLAAPERTVIAFSGDGCFQMTCQEWATAIQYDAAIILIVIDNGLYGTIRMHQERDYPGREMATSLRNPDFADWARSYGAFAATVTKTDEFAPALQAALAAKKPALLHIRLNPEILSPTLILDTSASPMAAG